MVLALSRPFLNRFLMVKTSLLHFDPRALGLADANVSHTRILQLHGTEFNSNLSKQNSNVYWLSWEKLAPRIWKTLSVVNQSLYLSLSFLYFCLFIFPSFFQTDLSIYWKTHLPMASQVHESLLHSQKCLDFTLWFPSFLCWGKIRIVPLSSVLSHQSPYLEKKDNPTKMLLLK